MISQTQDPNSVKAPSFGGAVEKLFSLVDKGTDIYRGGKERVDAIKAIDKETIKQDIVKVSVSEENSKFLDKDKTKFLGLASLGVGALALFLVMKKR